MTKHEEMTALEAIIRAWTVQGANPRHHQMMQAKLRSEWPSLASAIERALKEKQ